MGETVGDESRQIIESDAYAAHLGAKLLEIRPGYAKVALELGPQHRNFMDMIHGGVIFSLADVAFGAAANSFGKRAMALSVGIDFLAAPHTEGEITAEVELISRAGKMGYYRMVVVDGGGRNIAQCRGWAYHTERPLDEGGAEKDRARK